MFDSQLAAIAAARTPGERIRSHATLENSACAARLSAMADLLAAVLAADDADEREQWCFDNWAAVCAQIGAAHDVTSGVANTLLTDAVTLRDRLPKVAALFTAGEISYRQVHQICLRTALVQDPDALAAIDAELAELYASSGAMSKDQAEKAIDALILVHDPYAVRRTQEKSQGHRVDVHVEDASGTARVEASVSVTDGKAFDTRATALAKTVCKGDPRTQHELRAAAVGAMGFGWDRLPCLCESPDCQAATTPAVGGIVVHVIGRHDTLDPDPTPDDGPSDGPDDETGGSGGGPDPDPDGDPDDGPDADSTDADVAESDCRPDEFDHIPAVSELAPEPEPAAPERPPATAVPPVGDLTKQRRGLVGGPKDLLPKPWYSYSLSGLIAALSADPGQYCPAGPGVILGGAVVPTPVIAHAGLHATIRPLIHPGNAPPQPRYRPSTALADFVRCRDLTCRFPGCTRPATIADIDHTVPYPWGPTQASNLACLCREHHLLKTFWPGWSNRQYRDGTIVWTDPDGHTYTTHPGSRMLFPELCTPTADATTTGRPPQKHTAGLTMPRRTSTRAQDRAHRINAERAHSQELLENRETDSEDDGGSPPEPFPPEPPPPEDDEPPPF